MVAARLLNYGMPPDASFLVVNFMSEKGTNMHLVSREEGFRNYFSQAPERKKNLKILNIIGNNLQAIRQTLWEVFMAEKIAGVFVTNSRVFLVADFFYSNGIKNVRLIGYDLLNANIAHLQGNTIDFLISQKPLEQGFRSFMTLFEALVLKKNVQKYQYLPIDIITRENIDYYINNQTNE
jgi:LacI family transcriptional regulator